MGYGFYFCRGLTVYLVLLWGFIGFVFAFPSFAQGSKPVKAAQPNIELEADNIKYDSSGIAYAKGNVIILSEGLFKGEKVKIEAEDVVFDKTTFDLKVKGDVRILLTPSAMLLQGSDLLFNGTSNSGSMKNVSGRIPGFTQPRQKFSLDNFYLDNSPAFVDIESLSSEFLQASDELYVFNADLEIKPNQLTKFELLLRNATVTNTRRKDSDIKLKVKSLVFIPGRRVLMKGITPIIENKKLLTLPKYSKSFVPKNKTFSWSTPYFSRYDATGWNVHLNPNFHYNGATVSFPTTYSEELGLFSGVSAVVPLNGGEYGYLTSSTGKWLTSDIDANPVLVTDSDNIGLTIGRNVQAKPINWWVLQLEYGGISEQRFHEKMYYPRLDTRRFAINTTFALDPIQISKNLQLNTKFGGKHIEYSYTDRDLNEFSYSLQLQHKERIGSSSISYLRRLRTKNTGMLIDTNTPDDALNGKYRFRINEHWLGQLSSYYSFSDHEFDSAQVSATKLMNGYAITFSYEFVRNSPMVSFEFRGKDYYNKGRKVEPDNDVLRWPISSQDKF